MMGPWVMLTDVADCGAPLSDAWFASVCATTIGPMSKSGSKKVKRFEVEILIDKLSPPRTSQNQASLYSDVALASRKSCRTKVGTQIKSWAKCLEKLYLPGGTQRILHARDLESKRNLERSTILCRLRECKKYWRASWKC